ncbi:MAG: caspase family protein [Bacteroidales bacterium]|nr:caspase family protein [Bacteroidales bacterium]
MALCLILTAATASAQSTLEQANRYYDNKEYDKALPIYKQYAVKLNASAQFRLGYCYDICKDYSQAVHWYRKAADQGYATAQNNLGLCYESGKGVTKDLTQAVHWYQKAAEQGNARAQTNLGYCYESGKGVTKDLTQAVFWYRKAADQGYDIAQTNLGYCYESGKGVTKDFTQAVHWYQKAAEQGYARAQFNLGYYYEYGTGVTKDYSQAVLWYRKATEQGYAGAQNNLGRCYEYGNGVTQDFTQAVFWYQKAAEQGEVYAQYNLARCYANGNGVTKNLAEAGKWYKLAADNGHKSAKEKYTELFAQGYLSDKTSLAQSTTNPPKQKTTETVTPANPAPSNIDTDIPITGASQPNTFAVIIGNENYSSVAKVPFAANDAKVFAEYCTKTLGLPAENVSIYTDVTFGKLLGAISRMKNIADAYDGDINLIFYYAGHGIPDDASKQAYILPVDADGSIKESCYPLAKLYSTLASLNARRVMVFIDACFSGSERGNGMLTSARGVVIKPRENAIEGNLVVFSAVSGEQTAFPYTSMNHGLFTYYLLDKIKETRGNTTLGELSQYVTGKVKQKSIVINNKLQTPTITPSESLLNTWKSIPLR